MAEGGGKVFNAVEAGTESDICHGQIRIAEQQHGMLQPGSLQELVRGNRSECFEQAAEMEGAYITMRRHLHQRNIFVEMLCHVLLGPFNGGQVVLLQCRIELQVGDVIGNGGQHLVQHFNHQVIRLQFAGIVSLQALQDIEMIELHFSAAADKRGVDIIISKQLCLAELLLQLPVKGVFEFKDGALVRHGMHMGDGMLIPGFGHQHRAGIGVQRMTEHIEQEITFPDKTDGKSSAVFRPGCVAVIATAPEIEDAVKIRFVERMDVGLHGYMKVQICLMRASHPLLIAAQVCFGEGDLFTVTGCCISNRQQLLIILFCPGSIA